MSWNMNFDLKDKFVQRVRVKINGANVTEEIIDSLFVEAKTYNVIEFLGG